MTAGESSAPSESSAAPTARADVPPAIGGVHSEQRPQRPPRLTPEQRRAQRDERRAAREQQMRQDAAAQQERDRQIQTGEYGIGHHGVLEHMRGRAIYHLSRGLQGAVDVYMGGRAQIAASLDSRFPGALGSMREPALREASTYGIRVVDTDPANNEPQHMRMVAVAQDMAISEFRSRIHASGLPRDGETRVDAAYRAGQELRNGRDVRAVVMERRNADGNRQTSVVYVEGKYVVVNPQTGEISVNLPRGVDVTDIALGTLTLIPRGEINPRTGQRVKEDTVITNHPDDLGAPLSTDPATLAARVRASRVLGQASTVISGSGNRQVRGTAFDFGDTSAYSHEQRAYSVGQAAHRASQQAQESGVDTFTVFYGDPDAIRRMGEAGARFRGAERVEVITTPQRRFVTTDEAVYNAMSILPKDRVREILRLLPTDPDPVVALNKPGSSQSEGAEFASDVARELTTQAENYTSRSRTIESVRPSPQNPNGNLDTAVRLATHPHLLAQALGLGEGQQGATPWEQAAHGYDAVRTRLLGELEGVTGPERYIRARQLLVQWYGPDEGMDSTRDAALSALAETIVPMTGAAAEQLTTEDIFSNVSQAIAYVDEVQGRIGESRTQETAYNAMLDLERRRMGLIFSGVSENDPRVKILDQALRQVRANFPGSTERQNPSGPVAGGRVEINVHNGPSAAAPLVREADTRDRTPALSPVASANLERIRGMLKARRPVSDDLVQQLAGALPEDQRLLFLSELAFLRAEIASSGEAGTDSRATATPPTNPVPASASAPALGPAATVEPTVTPETPYARAYARAFAKAQRGDITPADILDYADLADVTSEEDRERLVREIMNATIPIERAGGQSRADGAWDAAAATAGGTPQASTSPNRE